MSIFIGRIQEREIIKDFVNYLDQTKLPIYLSIVGNGGMGKTKLLEWAREYSVVDGAKTTDIVDLSITGNRSKLNLLTHIVEALSNKHGEFSIFFDASKEYEIAKDIEKSYRFDNLLKAFVECVNNISQSNRTILIFDTYEATQGYGVDFPIFDILTLLTGKIGIILAGRNPIDLPVNIKYQIDLMPFTLDEVRSMAEEIYAERDIDFDLDDQTISLLHLRSEGRPILATLAVEWILENFLSEQLLESGGLFEEKLVQFLPKLRDEQESKAILIMATADRRFNLDIATILLGNASSKDAFSRLLRFSFIKHHLENSEEIFSLHDEMRRLINLYVDFTAQFKNELREKLIKNYYFPRLATSDFQLENKTLVTELIHYLIYSDLKQAMKLLNSNLQKAIKEYEFDFAFLLIREVALTFGEITDKNPAYISQMDLDLVDINKAELFLKQYKPGDAKVILDKLYSRRMLFEPEMRCRLLSGIASTMTNPSTTVEADLFDAINYWNEALQESLNHELKNYTGEILFQLASTYVLVGQHNHALKIFDQSLNAARMNDDKQLEAKVLNELGKLYRLRMELQFAKEPIENSMKIRKQINDEKNYGLSYYYLGNLYRDLNDFNNAMKFYELAKIDLLEIGDQNALCELYCDLSWYFVLNENWELAQHYNEMSQQIANKYLLGREISENLHIMYHLEMEKGNQALASEYLHKAYDVAKRYLNVYMILDCSMHIAQEAYRNKDYNKVPEILLEMENLEKKGCGIRVFTGRTINVYGDCLYDQGDYKDALAKWAQGFTIIAVHGNSRTNVELFEDHFNSRKQRLKDVLLKCGKESIINFKVQWFEKVIQHGYSFDQMIRLCDDLLTSFN